MLLAALVMIWRESRTPVGGTTVRGLAKIGESFYIAVIGTQLTLVLLVAPAATAGAISHDRATGTILHVLVTDLSNSEIAIGKLLARLLPVLGLVGCALPILAILTLLGGVDPDALYGASLVTVGIAFLGCALALFFSLTARKTHEALVATYAVWGIWLLAGPFLNLINNAFGSSLSLPAAITDPYHLAFAPYYAPGTVSLANFVAFLVVTTIIALALVIAVVFRLRAVCTRVTVAKKKSVRGWLDRLGARLDLTRFLPAPPLDFNPVLWREWRRARSARWARFVGMLYVVGAITASVAAIVLPRATYAMAWVNGFQVSIGMLLLSVTAATSLAEERVRGSLDVLMATSLSTRAIVLGKWLGTFRLVPLFAILPTIVVLSNDVFKRNYLSTVVITFVFVLVCGAAITALGLAMATWCSRIGRALTLTVSAYVLVAVGWLFMAMLVHGGSPGFLMLSPFFCAGELAADLCSGGPSTRSNLDAALFWTMCYGVAAIAFLCATLATFNRCLGRIEYGLPETYRWMPTDSPPARAAEIRAEALDPV
jgi:ABC-type transport system involved in multi-copper enzyme maturation permease subunit